MSTENEQNMIPPNLAQSQKKAGEVYLPQVEKAYDGWFKKVTELQNGDIIMRGNCKFCNHPLRADAEKKWEETHNYSVVLRMFEEYHKSHPDDTPMNHMNIRAHLINHYEQSSRKVLVREYGDRLQEMLNYKISKDQMLDMLATSLQMKYMEIASDGELDKAKQGETMVKISKMLLEIGETQARLKGELNTSSVIAEKLVNVWVSMVSQERDPEVKNRLIEKLEIFRNEMSALSNG